VPAGPVYDVLQVHADVQVEAHARWSRSSTPRSARSNPGLPVKFSDTPGKVRTGAPVYGQHTREVLRAHGFADAEIEALLADGAIAVAE
jgi:crotonobetainyl-CoA:carnitine CoA-transferase CaiB-like acyl-CoA transferase